MRETDSYINLVCSCRFNGDAMRNRTRRGREVGEVEEGEGEGSLSAGLFALILHAGISTLRLSSRGAAITS